MPRFRLSMLLLSLGLLLGCFPKGDPSQPVPTALVPGTQPAGQARTLVVVLPGRGDDIEGLRRARIAEAIHEAWPEADVVLTGLALSYYMSGTAERRLHDEVVAPMRARGYREVWLVGASMGGMGALMFDRRYPGTIDGMVLLAPYLGDRALLRDIADAGGVARWNPGPVPATVDADNFQVELWRHIKGWSVDPAKARNVWLAYGDGDRLRKAMPLLVPVLRPEQVSVRDGGHTWTVWSPAARDALRQARQRGT